MTPEEADALAGEFVLGTLSAAERAAFERALARDPALEATVRAWETRLSGLDRDVLPAVPTAAVWTRIAAALPLPAGAAPPAEEPALGAPTPVDIEEWRRLARSRSRWRGAALAAGALAASLVVAIGLQRIPQPAAPSEQYVAVVNRGGDQPALVVRVDLASRTVLIRPVSAEAPAGRSLELWYIGPGQSPKSLGVVDGDARTLTIPAVFGGAGGVADRSTFAVTVEPQGGSPTGGPTGPVVYSGQLIRE